MIEEAFNLGPVDVKFDQTGKFVAASSLDNSLKVFSLQESSDDEKNCASRLECEASGDVADAWKIDFSPDM